MNLYIMNEYYYITISESSLLIENLKSFFELNREQMLKLFSVCFEYEEHVFVLNALCWDLKEFLLSFVVNNCAV